MDDSRHNIRGFSDGRTVTAGADGVEHKIKAVLPRCSSYLVYIKTARVGEGLTEAV